MHYGDHNGDGPERYCCDNPNKKQLLEIYLVMEITSSPS